jgi:hypothetical protein
MRNLFKENEAMCDESNYEKLLKRWVVGDGESRGWAGQPAFTQNNRNNKHGIKM